jgi:hypothetical protein
LGRRLIRRLVLLRLLLLWRPLLRLLLRRDVGGRSRWLLAREGTTVGWLLHGWDLGLRLGG